MMEVGGQGISNELGGRKVERLQAGPEKDNKHDVHILMCGQPRLDFVRHTYKPNAARRHYQYVALRRKRLKRWF